MNFALVGLFSNHFTAIATSFYFLISLLTPRATNPASYLAWLTGAGIPL